MTARWLHSDKAARLAVSRDWWWWMPGMVVCDDGYVSYVTEVRGNVLVLAGDRGGPWSAGSCTPSLAHPATLGCIEFALLPERHGFDAEICHHDGEWWLRRPGLDGEPLDVADPRARGEALVAAMEVEP